jgi:hypothetical protein
MNVSLYDRFISRRRFKLILIGLFQDVDLNLFINDMRMQVVNK